MDRRYALRDQDPFVDGEGLTWWLYLGTASGTPHVGFQPLEPAETRGWWRVPGHVHFDPASSPVELVGEPWAKVARYRRTRDVEGYRDELSIEEYWQRADSESDQHDPLVRPLYEEVREPQPPTRAPVEGPWLVLDGAPPPDDGFEWLADLPYELRHQPQYRHLFPGKFTGFRAALTAALEEVDGVRAYNLSGRAFLSVDIRLNVPKLEPPEKWAARPHLDGRSAHDRKKTLEAHNSSIQQITRRLEIPAGDYVEGRNRAQARRLWDETITEIVEYVRGVVAEKCPTCGGRGFVEPDHEEERQHG